MAHSHNCRQWKHVRVQSFSKHLAKYYKNICKKSESGGIFVVKDNIVNHKFGNSLHLNFAQVRVKQRSDAANLGTPEFSRQKYAPQCRGWSQVVVAALCCHLLLRDDRAWPTRLASTSPGWQQLRQPAREMAQAWTLCVRVWNCSWNFVTKIKEGE